MEPGLCKNCNFFFGSQEGLCSKCYKDSKTEKNSSVLVSENVDTQKPANSTEESKQKVDSSHCYTCKRKLGPVNFKCKCNYFYCSKHRLPEEHNCTYNHKEAGIRKLSEENPFIQAEKFNKL